MRCGHAISSETSVVRWLRRKPLRTFPDHALITERLAKRHVKSTSQPRYRRSAPASLPRRAGLAGEFMEETAITFVAVAAVALAGLVFIARPSLTFWQNDES